MQYEHPPERDAHRTALVPTSTVWIPDSHADPANNDASARPGDKTSGSPQPGVSPWVLNRYEGFLSDIQSIGRH